MHAEGNSYSAAPNPAEARKPLESFFIEPHRHDHPCREWERRVMHYVSAEAEEAVARLLCELRQIETRLVINMHNLDKSGFFQNSEPAATQEFAYQKWIHILIETIEEERSAARKKQSSGDAEKGLDGVRPGGRAVA